VAGNCYHPTTCVLLPGKAESSEPGQSVDFCSLHSPAGCFTAGWGLRALGQLGKVPGSPGSSPLVKKSVFYLLPPLLDTLGTPFAGYIDWDIYI
jgi:hypothetical protein